MADRDGRAVRPSPLTRVAVHSDDQLFSEGLLRILDGLSTYTIVDYRAVDESRPHVILLDSRMESALLLCESIASAGSGTSVIFFAAPDEREFAARALATGARGILPKSARVEDLVCAIEDVRGGLFWATPEVLAARIDFLSARETALDPSPDPSIEQQLSAREREVLRHAVMGKGNKEVADRLAISEATVKVHLTHIFQKLRVNGRAELAAVYHGVIRKS